MRSLWDRSVVLLEGLASSTQVYLPMQNPELELLNLLPQMAAIPEARYVTITGYGIGSTIYNDHVWASNDPDILSKIDTAELRPGVSRIQDALSPRLAEIANELNARTRDEVETARHIYSEPDFSFAHAVSGRDSVYTLSKPFMFRQSSDDNYFRGLIRLEISTDSIQAQISSGQVQLLRVILIVAFAAIVIGTIGALAL
jgi:hypothetical protein